MIWLSFLWAIPAAAADVTGLRQQSEVKITAQMAGAPFEAEPAPSVWAISFSPDGRYLAFGVQFARAKDYSHPSYLFVVSPDRPDVVLKKFEMPRHPAMRHVSRLVWSSDGRFVSVTPYGEDWYQVAVVDLGANQVRVISNRNGSGWCDGVGALLPGPQVLERCFLSRSSETVFRFLRLDGTAAREGWTFPASVSLLGVSPDGGMLALDFPQTSSGTKGRHEVAILNVGDRTEVRRWPLPEASAYSGTFAESGTAFCTVPDANFAALVHQIVCRDIANGREISQSVVARGPIFRVGAAGDRIFYQHYGALVLPFSLFGTNIILTHHKGSLSDVQTGQAVAEWRIDTQWVLPKADASFESAVSSDGELVAVGGSGSLRVYRVSR